MAETNARQMRLEARAGAGAAQAMEAESRPVPDIVPWVMTELQCGSTEDLVYNLERNVKQMEPEAVAGAMEAESRPAPHAAPRVMTETGGDTEEAKPEAAWPLEVTRLLEMMKPATGMLSLYSPDVLASKAGGAAEKAAEPESLMEAGLQHVG